MSTTPQQMMPAGLDPSSLAQVERIAQKRIRQRNALVIGLRIAVMP